MTYVTIFVEAYKLVGVNFEILREFLSSFISPFRYLLGLHPYLLKMLDFRLFENPNLPANFSCLLHCDPLSEIVYFSDISVPLGKSCQVRRE